MKSWMCAIVAVVLTWSVAAQAPEQVYVNGAYTDVGDNDGHQWGVDAFATIQGGLDAVAAGGTVTVAAGTYAEELLISNSVTLTGAPAGALPIVELPGTDAAGITIQASAVTVAKLHFRKAYTGDNGSSQNCILSIPRGGTWAPAPNIGYTIAHHGITLRDCVFECSRRAGYLTAGDLTITGCTFTGQTRDILYFNAVSGTTTIADNQFLGATNSRKALLFENFSSSDPVTSGNLVITGNYVQGKTNFLVYNQWQAEPAVSDAEAALTLQVRHNTLDGLGGAAVSFYVAYTNDPLAFAKFTQILVQDNIFANSGPAVWVDYEDYGGAPPADNRPVPAAGQLQVAHNLFFGNAAGDNATLDASGNFGFHQAAGMTPAGATMAMYAATDNLLGDPRFVAEGATLPEFYALYADSPAVDAASDATHIGAFQGEPTALPRTYHVVYEIKGKETHWDAAGKTTARLRAGYLVLSPVERQATWLTAADGIVAWHLADPFWLETLADGKKSTLVTGYADLPGDATGSFVLVRFSGTAAPLALAADDRTVTVPRRLEGTVLRGDADPAIYATGDYSASYDKRTTQEANDTNQTHDALVAALADALALPAAAPAVAPAVIETLPATAIYKLTGKLITQTDDGRAKTSYGGYLLVHQSGVIAQVLTWKEDGVKQYRVERWDDLGVVLQYLVNDGRDDQQVFALLTADCSAAQVQALLGEVKDGTRVGGTSREPLRAAIAKALNGVVAGAAGETVVPALATAADASLTDGTFKYRLDKKATYAANDEEWSEGDALEALILLVEKAGFAPIDR